MTDRATNTSPAERDPIKLEDRAITLAKKVLVERHAKDREKFPPESTREEIIAWALVNLTSSKPPHSINTNELLEAAKTLVSKLDQINEDPAFVGVFQMASIHGAPYGGPSWVSELDALRTAISNAEKAI